MWAHTGAIGCVVSNLSTHIKKIIVTNTLIKAQLPAVSIAAGMILCMDTWVTHVLQSL